VLIFLFLTTLLPTSDQNLGSEIWDIQREGLYQNIQDQQWYLAKQNLSQLKIYDPDRYRNEEFVLTEAWIAEQEGSWQMVLRAYAEWAKEHPRILLPQLMAKVELGQLKEALAFYNENKNAFPNQTQWEAVSLYAKAQMKLEQYDQALAVYERLRSQKAPRNLKMDAVYYSAAIHYARSDRAKARKFVAVLHETWPGSDEALDAIHLQERSETETYLQQEKVLHRFSSVAYANRDFDRARLYFKKIAEEGAQSYDRDRARYFLALIPLKLGEPEEGLKAFREFLDHQEGGRFFGLGSYQFARSLIMLKKDQEVISYCRPLWEEASNPPKWLQDCAKFLILAMRRTKDEEGFRRFEHQLDQKSAGGNLRSFYHRNGVVWALQRGLPHQANHHLQELKKYKLGRGEYQENKIWQGLIERELGREEQAVALWLSVVTSDPNHYFGLIAGQLLQTYGRLEERWDDQALLKGAKSNDPAYYHRLYHLAPDPETKAAVAERLRSFFPILRSDLDHRFLPKESKARAYAEIGRFDWASEYLRPSETDTKTAQYLKAKWNLQEGAYQHAIIWGEGLLRSFPSWTPYELFPKDIQEFIYPEGFSKIVHEKATDFSVDPYLLLAIIREESKFNASAKSVASARGLMQFIPSTATAIANEVDSIVDFNLSKLYEPEISITLGARYVDKLMDLFEGRSIQTVAAYNAGELSVERWTSYSDEFNPLHFVWDVAYDETKYYCQKVLRAYYHYVRVYDENPQAQLLSPDTISSKVRTEKSWPLPAAVSAE